MCRPSCLRRRRPSHTQHATTARSLWSCSLKSGVPWSRVPTTGPSSSGPAPTPPVNARKGGALRPSATDRSPSLIASSTASAHGGSSATTKSTPKSSRSRKPDARRRKPSKPKPLRTPPRRTLSPKATPSPCVSASCARAPRLLGMATLTHLPPACGKLCTKPVRAGFSDLWQSRS